MRVRPRTRLQMHSGNDLHRWTVSLADFMTLMFAVFVVLYAVSVSNEEKYKDVMLSIQNASKLLNHSVFSSEHAGILTKESNSIIEDSGPAILADKSAMQGADEHSDVQAVNSGRELSALKFKLTAALASELDDDSVRLQLDGDWLTIEMDGNLLFVGGSHTLLTSAKKKIKKLAVLLKSINNRLKIRGYTDQESISNEIYRSNWELAGARAFAVLHELNRFGIAGKRMVMEAYGQYSPVVDKNGNIDKLKSRRVVIAVSKYAVVDNNVINKQEKSLLEDKDDNSEVAKRVVPDSEKMHELHLPNNRLIITTRQK